MVDTQVAHAKCIRQSVLTVARNVKFLSSPLKVNLFIAENAFRNTESTKAV